MANQLQMLGAQNETPSKYATLYVNQIFTGYWTNRNPLREGAVPFLYQKFYNASRNDSIIAGLNTEVSPRMTLVRRFGHSIYNSQTFANVQALYSFKPFQAGIGESVIVIADQPEAVYNATGPNTKVNLLMKGTTARTRFLGLENTLFMANGVDSKKWSWFPAWQANTSYAPGTSVLDVNGNIQQCLGYGANITFVEVASDVASVTYSSAGGAVIIPGDVVTFYSVSAAPSLNNVTQTVVGGPNPITVGLFASDFSVVPSTGAVVDITKGNAESGGAYPGFPPAQYTLTQDGTAIWVNWGNAVQNTGIASPAEAPTVQAAPLLASAAWAASTYYWPQPYILDSNSDTGPYVWQLTTPGTTTTSVPSGLSSGSPAPEYSGGTIHSPTTVTDGTAVWTCNSLAARQIGAEYVAGQTIAVSWVYPYSSGGAPTEVTYQAFFKCVQAGTTTTSTVSIASCTQYPVFDWGPYFLQPTATEFGNSCNLINDGSIFVPSNGFPTAGGYRISVGGLVSGYPGTFLCTGSQSGESEAPGFTFAEYNNPVSGLPDTTNAASVASCLVLVSTSSPHGLVVGSPVTISGTTGYDGTFVVYSVVDTENFLFDLGTSQTAPSTGGSIVVSQPQWPPALGATITDGFGSSLVWQNVGVTVTRTSVSTSLAPSGGGIDDTVVGTVGNSQLVSNTAEISDTVSNGEIPVVAGPSGSSHPTWATTLGAQTVEGSGLTWSNQGPFQAANTGNWFYAYSYVNSATGDESTASPLSLPILLPASSGVLISGVGSPDPQVGLIRIYRSTQTVTSAVSGNGPFLLTTIVAPPNGAQWSFFDTTPDPPNPGATLDVLITASGYVLTNGIITNLNDPPPAGLTNLAYFLGRVFGSVGNIVYYSTGPDITVGNGATSWDADNFYELPGTVYRMWPTTIGLYIFTSDGAYIITGLGTPASPFSEAQLVDQGTSIASYDAFDFKANQAIAYLSDNTFISIDATNGSSDLGEPIGDFLAGGYAPSHVYVTSHKAGLDKRFFITNGSTQWVNIMAVPAPETGYCWSPPAQITSPAGILAVQSIETAPGVYKLLLGSGPAVELVSDITFIQLSVVGSTNYMTVTAANEFIPGQLVTFAGVLVNTVLNGDSLSVYSSTPTTATFVLSSVAGLSTSTDTGTMSTSAAGGPLLFRDPTTFTDNGAAYEAFAVIGNIVLAHPGQMAAPAFITIRAVNNAGSSAPAISVLADEIYGQPNTPSFAMLPNPVNEPPRLPASATLYSLRYWMIASQEPIWMQHMLLRIDFGTDTVQDEILDYGIFGKYVTEKA